MKSTIQKYMEMAVRNGHVKNYSELAEKLQISTASISQMRQGQSGASDETLVNLARIVQEDPITVLSEYHIEHSNGYWLTRTWRRIHSAVTPAFLVVGLGAIHLAQTMINYRALYIM